MLIKVSILKIAKFNCTQCNERQVTIDSQKLSQRSPNLNKNSVDVCQISIFAFCALLKDMYFINQRMIELLCEYFFSGLPEFKFSRISFLFFPVWRKGALCKQVSQGPFSLPGLLFRQLIRKLCCVAQNVEYSHVSC